jgi:hypothetical protein
MMRTFVLAVVLAAGATTLALADQSPSYNGALSAREAAFVSSIQKDLMARYPTAADAVRAGYIRYTYADSTGAISYANLHWQSPDAQHPSQLWYDKAGHLLGADYSVLVANSKTRPSIMGCNPGRDYEFDDHIHYVLTSGHQYDNWVLSSDWHPKSGDSTAHATAADLVQIGKVKSASQVATVFDFPSIWDLIVWVKPNPKGAFAESNPNVKP